MISKVFQEIWKHYSYLFWWKLHKTRMQLL